MQWIETNTYLNAFELRIRTIYNEPTLKSTQRGAYITAAKKRARTAYLVEYIKEQGHIRKWDLTPTFCLRLIQGWLGRGVDQQVLRQHFGTPCRTAENISRDFDNIELYIAQLKPNVQSQLDIVDADLAVILSTVQAEVLGKKPYRSPDSDQDSTAN